MWKKKKFNQLIRSKVFLRTAVIIGVVSMILILLSSYIKTDMFHSDQNNPDYAEDLKTRLLDIITQIDGVGEAKVFLTMDNTGENVYLTNTDTKTKSIEPTVRGVVIVCEGGDDPVVADRVLGAVTRSLSISSDKVYITKLDGHSVTVTE